MVDTDLNEALDAIENLQNVNDLLSKEKELLICESQSLNRKIKDLEYEIEQMVENNENHDQSNDEKVKSLQR